MGAVETSKSNDPCAGRAIARRGAGCAFCGARKALMPIADVVHLVHGPVACLGHNWVSRPTWSSGPEVHRIDFTTDLGILDIIHGGEDKLRRAIEAAFARHDPAAVLVYQSCVPALIGDDIRSVCRDVSGQLARPVVAIDLPGYVGGKYYGTLAAGDVLLDQVIGTGEPEKITTTDVVLIGEYNVAGELGQVRALLARLGIRVAAAIPGDGRFADIAAAHRARLSVTLCSQALGDLGTRLQERHGVPTMDGSFHGREAIAATLRQMAAMLSDLGGPPDLVARTEALITAEEARTEASLIPYRARLSGQRALLATGGIKSWSLIDILHDLGMEVVGTTTQKSSPAERCRAADRAGADRLISRIEPGRLHPEEIDVVLAGGPAGLPVLKAGIPFVEINHERTFALCGYDGPARLAAAIDRAIHHPLWRQPLLRAPWEMDGAAHNVIDIELQDILSRSGRSGKWLALAFK